MAGLLRLNPLFLAACLLVATLFPASSDAQTLLRVIRESEEHKVFARLIPLDSVDELLGRTNETYTVFAPTDDAFSKLVKDLNEGQAPSSPDETVTILETVNALLADNTPSVTDIVKYHVLRGSRDIQGLADASPLRTLAGRSYRINVTAEPSRTVIDDAPDNSNASVSGSAELSNGYLYIVTEVLLPVPALAIVQALQAATTPTPSVTPSTSPSMPDESPSPSMSPGSTVSMMTPSPSMSATASASPVSAPGGGVPGGGDGGDMASPQPSGEAEDGEDDPVCFPAGARVSVAGVRGGVRMADLKEGDRVRHSGADSAGAESDTHSAVFLFTHRAPGARSRMVRIVTACGHAVVLSPGHYVRAGDGALIAARAVRAGVDAVQTVSGKCGVTATERVTATGLYAPHSLHGDIVVDGVVASSYSAAVHPAVAHALLAPVRWVAKHGLATAPLGTRAFRDGADRLAAWMPKGGDRVRGH